MSSQTRLLPITATCELDWLVGEGGYNDHTGFRHDLEVSALYKYWSVSVSYYIVLSSPGIWFVLISEKNMDYKKCDFAENNNNNNKDSD